jgi:hypothetical protein
MVDITSLTEGLALFKSGMDGLRAAIGIARDIRGVIPEAQRNEVNRALEQSERQLQIAEAQIAIGLGYTLCECEFPPTPMLTVGWIERGKNRPVHRCPRCGVIDNGGDGWTTTEEIRKRGERGSGSRAQRS